MRYEPRWVKLFTMAAPKKTLEEILSQARRLPDDEQRRLLEDLQGGKLPSPSESQRRGAMKRWLARAGTGHADVSDISSNKNKYLAETYATKQ
jgi:hypothetical protein